MSTRSATASVACSPRYSASRAKATTPRPGALIETYGVHFDPELRDEVVARVDALNLPSYTAFVMPRLTPVHDATGAISDVEMSYPCDLEAQMLEYSAFARHRRAAVAADDVGDAPSAAHREVNAITRAVERLRAAGAPYIDLTRIQSHTGRPGLSSDICSTHWPTRGRCVTSRTRSVCAPRARPWRDEFARRGATWTRSTSLLSASTSEAYSWLFKLLCDPGDARARPAAELPAVRVPDPRSKVSARCPTADVSRPVGDRYPRHRATRRSRRARCWRCRRTTRPGRFCRRATSTC